MILRKVCVALALLVSSTVVAAAGAGASSTPLIVSGVSQWGALARQLVGPEATVVSLLTDPNADPHDHESTVADALNVTKASVVLVNGAGYDTWLSQLVKARPSKVAVIDVASLMNVSTGKNPHLFYDPVAAIRFVRTLTSLLEHRAGFEDVARRADALLARLASIQHEALSIKSSCAAVHVAATEDVATYLLVDMGLDVVTPEGLRLAVGNNVDPSVHDFAVALAQLQHHPAFLVDNVQTATPLTNEMVGQASSSGVPVIKVTETMTGTSYVTWIATVVAAIRRDLVREGCLA